MPIVRPYGTWPSPISAELITGTQVGLASPWLDGADVYWAESRPLEGGRVTLIRRDRDGAQLEVTPAPFNLRTRVHEYGGRAFTARNGVVVGVEFRDQRVYRLEQGKPPQPLTPESGGKLRYADLVLDPSRGRVLAIREDHRGDGEPVNTLVALGLEGDPGEGEILAGGHDFFAYPRPSPDATQLAWITWDHPNMPWDSSQLWVAGLDEAGFPLAPVAVETGAEESLVQPEWSPGGQLHVVSDRSDFWSLYRVDGQALVPVALIAAELAGPLWNLGARWYDFIDDGTALAIATERGRSRLVRLDLATGADATVDLPFVEYAGVTCAAGRALVQALAEDAPGAIVLIELDQPEFQVVASGGVLDLGQAVIARAEHITFASGDGRQAFALYYPPTNPDSAAPDGELPPLVVRSHGGPTGRASPALNLQIQFWTSRGFAVVDVDYAGSTGYGRAYRSLLDGKWGVLDVEDCIAAARHLAEIGKADPDRLAIRGGSAGGYTTLCALTFHDCFKAGASWYGIGDLEALLRDTHKFESRYLDRLVGPWPESAEIYRARSPIHHTDGLSCPVIFLQGLDDKVVPPNQAEAMIDALRRKGVAVAYLPFPGEGHGFRAAGAIQRAMLAEYAFFCRVFGISPAEGLPGLEIENLPAS
ncbi:MAG: alpha/beta hydrolase family protein [Geminicoccaceae bacterium]